MTAIAALFALALLIFELVLVARLLLDWVGVLAPASAGQLGRARGYTYAVTEPVISRVRRLVPPLRVGSVSVDVAFTLVLVATVVLRGLLLSL